MFRKADKYPSHSIITVSWEKNADNYVELQLLQLVTIIVGLTVWKGIKSSENC